MHDNPSRTLRETAFDRLRQAIVTGALPAGARIGEEDTARLLGISRTPLREALAQLGRQGFVVSRPGCGYRVAALTAGEAAELYPLLGALERFALEHRPPFSRRDKEHLRRLHARFHACQGVKPRRIELDDALHRAWTARCPNSQLQEMLETLRARACRYEWVYGEVDTFLRSHAEHEGILRCCLADDLRGAGRRLERHQADSVPRLLERIEAAGLRPIRLRRPGGGR